ncbi:zinc transport system substrate-binding protein [Aliiruegeria haliotis]|uniref:High-affinity zinc uptake system protein ZnuA n=1 Tax=Aliiruegeria haliotis TaxID=1280846 RepID=A0A2T0RNF7_9RHOB|nr:zinc ABC transporter substrate-binding protein [Aliiruegeria haliotis]PRY22667.1 zinc transport system substrate-binding protein [Aliiruegeria haliotis]
MIRLSSGISALALSISAPAWAEVPNVVADFAPVQSLVAQVMGDLADPNVILPPGASPHSHAMRPSEARVLSRADIVFWVGEDLTPWMDRALETLAPDAHKVELLEVEGTVLREFRTGATFDAHDHEHEGSETDHDDRGHDDHSDHDEGADHDDHADHDRHTGDDDHAAEAHHAHDGHAHDPHAWLDPENGRRWLAAIADTLSEADPENADTYAANAQAGIDGLTALQAELAEELSPIRNLSFVVFHDAFQYFERRFGLNAAGAITLGDASDPSAARLTEVRDAIVSLDVTCVAAEPQFNPDLINAVAEGAGVTTTVLDPAGLGLEDGPTLYPDLLRGIASGLLACR